MESALRKRRLGAAWFVVGCGVSLACGGRSMKQDGDARGGDAGDTSTGRTAGGSDSARSGGTGGTGASRGGDTGAPGGARGGNGPIGRGGAETGGTETGGTGGEPGGERAFEGICEQHGHATVTTSTFAGYEDFFIWSEEIVSSGGRLEEPMEGDLVCRIRFDVSRVGPAPAGCVDLDDVPCEWTHTVEYSNPQVLIDVDGACGKSEVGWNQAFIDGMNGSRVSYGYLLTFLGHDETLYTYSETTGEWIEFARAYWDETTGAFEYVLRLGACRY